MKNLNKMTFAELQKKYMKCIKVEERTSRFNSLAYDLSEEIYKRQRALIYKTCCWALDNKGSNQFFMAKMHTDATMNELFASDDHYEIGSYYTKNRRPVLIWFK